MGKKAMELLPVAMLSFEEFKKEVLENIREKLPEEDYEIRVHKVESPTRSYEGLAIFETGENIAPTINLSEIYSYSAAVGANLGEAMDSIADTYKFAKKPFIDLDINKLLDYESIREKVTVRLLNGERENAGLANSAHKELGSFEAAYYISIGSGEAAISKKMMEEYGVSADDLHAQAIQNQAKGNGARLTDMLDSIVDMQNGGKGSVENRLDTDLALIPGVMYVLTNSDGRYGSSLILDTELMDKIADKCATEAEKFTGKSDGNMYVVPSSVHEVLIMRDDPSIGIKVDPGQLDAMIQSTNRDVVDPKEVLGDRALIYERETHTLYYAKEYEQGQKIEALKDKSPDHQRIQSLGPEVII